VVCCGTGAARSGAVIPTAQIIDPFASPLRRRVLQIPPQKTVIGQGLWYKLRAASFLPVQVVNEAAVPDPQPLLPHTASPQIAATTAGRIEITLPDGSHVQVDNDVSLTALRRVVTALRG
jgi:hypothetical protein